MFESQSFLETIEDAARAYAETNGQLVAEFPSQEVKNWEYQANDRESGLGPGNSLTFSLRRGWIAQIGPAYLGIALGSSKQNQTDYLKLQFGATAIEDFEPASVLQHRRAMLLKLPIGQHPDTPLPTTHPQPLNIEDLATIVRDVCGDNYTAILKSPLYNGTYQSVIFNCWNAAMDQGGSRLRYTLGNDLSIYSNRQVQAVTNLIRRAVGMVQLNQETPLFIPSSSKPGSRP